MPSFTLVVSSRRIAMLGMKRIDPCCLTGSHRLSGALLQLRTRKLVNEAPQAERPQPIVSKALVRRRHDHSVRKLVSAVQAHLQRPGTDDGPARRFRAPATILRWIIRYSVTFA